MRQNQVPAEPRRRNVTSQSKIPQLAAISGGTSKTLDSAAMVAICDPPPTAGNCSIEPTMLAPIRIKTCDTGISSDGHAIGVRHFLIRQRDDVPHSNRNQSQQEQRQGP